MRKSGKDSVETMLNKLYAVRKQQERQDKNLNDLREQVKAKEDMIKQKEDLKCRLKADIHDQQVRHDEEFAELREILEQQSKKLLA